MPYVIVRTDQGGGYVSGRRGASYTRRLEQARIYGTKDEAERDRCPENEVAVTVESRLRQ